MARVLAEGVGLGYCDSGHFLFLCSRGPFGLILGFLSSWEHFELISCVTFGREALWGKICF
jgi:hypothetical protein